MDESIGDILKLELSTRRPQVAFWKPVALQVAVHWSHQREAADVEFARFK